MGERVYFRTLLLPAGVSGRARGLCPAPLVSATRRFSGRPSDRRSLADGPATVSLEPPCATVPRRCAPLLSHAPRSALCAAVVSVQRVARGPESPCGLRELACSLSSRRVQSVLSVRVRV